MKLTTTLLLLGLFLSLGLFLTLGYEKKMSGFGDKKTNTDTFSSISGDVEKPQEAQTGEKTADDSGDAYSSIEYRDCTW
ncbi:hypothetical protein ACSBQJ_13205 [Enterococcus sp. G203Y]|uniref:hypothetical protein n=1 Tax=Enterococcus TaxID=1350 RepID=UPI003A842342